MNWQDIDSAPRDGTQILAARWNDCMWIYFVVWWLGADPYPWEGDRNSYVEGYFHKWCPITELEPWK